VEDYVGAFSDVDALDTWFTQGAHRLIDLVSEDVLGPYARISGFLYANAHPTAGSYRIWSVAVGGNRATFVPASRWPLVTDPGSNYRATNDFPAWTWYNGSMDVYPQSTATFVGTPKGAVGHLDETIPNVPAELVQAVVLYVALNARLRQLNNTLADGLTALVFETSGAVPTAPAAPAFTHTAATSAVSIPSAAVIPMPDPPTFTAPTHSIDFSKVVTLNDTEEDVELASSKLNEVATRLKDYEAEVATAVQDFQADALVYKEMIAANTREVELTLQALIESSKQSADLSVRNNDAETARQVSEYAAKLNKYQTEVQAYLGIAQGEAQRFDAEVKRVTADVSLMQAQLQNIRMLYMESLQALGLVAPVQEKAQ